MNNLPNLKKLPNQEFWTQNDCDWFGIKNHAKQMNKSVSQILAELDGEVLELLNKKGE